MMYSCAPAARGGARATVKKRGRSLTVDIHCHYMNTEVATKVAPLNPSQHEPMALYSNAATREVNARQVQERGAKLSDIAVRLKDMDRMGIDIQAVSPAPHQTYYWTDPGMGAELARALNERLAEIVAQHADRFVALGTVPLPGCLARRGGARALREEARHARRGDQSQRARHGSHRREAQPRGVLRSGAQARRGHLHAPDRLHAR